MPKSAVVSQYVSNPMRLNQSADLLPQHTPTEVEALREDLRANGLKVPVIVDENGEIIDGKLRAKLCDTLNIPWKPTAKVETELTADQKAALRIKLNILRRSTPPTAQQKRGFLEVILKAEPFLSNGAIATSTTRPAISSGGRERPRPSPSRRSCSGSKHGGSTGTLE